MDKIMEKTSIKSRIDEAVKEANERKAESKTIEEVTDTEKNIDKIKVVGKKRQIQNLLIFRKLMNLQWKKSSLMMI